MANKWFLVKRIFKSFLIVFLLYFGHNITTTVWSTFNLIVYPLILTYAGSGSNVYHHQHITGWTERRKHVMSKSLHKKVLLFCYMNGGSTYFSEFFRGNQDVTFWYEPVAPFYNAHFGADTWVLPQHVFWAKGSHGSMNRRYLPEWEREALARYNHNLLTCNISQLPVDTLGHSGLFGCSFREYRSCIHRYSNKTELSTCRDGTITDLCRGEVSWQCRDFMKASKGFRLLSGDKSAAFSQNNDLVLNHFIDYHKCKSEYYDNFIVPCLDIVKTKCEMTHIVAYKALRLSMRYMSSMLEMDPDMHVIYLVRDPRSILSSRKSPISTGAKYLCWKMYEDLQEYRKLKKTYKNAFKMVRYEEAVKNPSAVAEDVYDFIDEELGQNVEELLRKNGWDIRNATVQSEKWRSNIPVEDHPYLSEVCRDVLSELGYQLT